ncbi:hypothetical protein DC366_07585 [Pelagivirga sediminicola]|uniref:Translocase n=1 Tax=Pelagivirga sediminicola TaxID=2170575 RepID=A0A2T7G8I1_9RHOB|nr:hypothetical protein [Pelagivirga sediminicola]PVA10729.1 hypothetical protein DC366_07585 [Pelagivirga sediminicola]
MQKIRIFAMGCGTLALALGAGHFMQTSGAASAGAPQKQATAAGANGPSGTLELSSIELTSAIPAPPGDAQADAILPAPLAAQDTREAALSDAEGVTLTDALPAEVPAPSLACEYTLTADPAPGAMVALSLDAPCARSERFTLHHNGMMFTQITDEGGHASMLVPALAKSAVFIAGFSNGDGAVAQAQVDALETYQRVAVQWQGDSGLALHALEFGAEFGSEGHVWAEARRDVAAASDGDRGFMTLLGDADQPNALMAQVYTFPSRLDGRDGDIDLQVEAEVTQANCAKDIEAQTLQMQPGRALNVQDLTLMMPECDAVGDFLVLKNLVNDITIARN